MKDLVLPRLRMCGAIPQLPPTYSNVLSYLIAVIFGLRRTSIHSLPCSAIFYPSQHKVVAISKETIFVVASPSQNLFTLKLYYRRKMVGELYAMKGTTLLVMFTFYEYNYVSPVGNGNVPCIYHMRGKHI
jgi:hypothetical protein